jgi:hypothetical protein
VVVLGWVSSRLVPLDDLRVALAQARPSQPISADGPFDMVLSKEYRARSRNRT